MIFGDSTLESDNENELEIEYVGLDFNNEEEKGDDGDGFNGDVYSIKYICRDFSWHQKIITYYPELQ